MYITGWAFKPNELELRDENVKRYKEIAHLAKQLKIKKTSCYGHTKFQGVLETDEAKALSEKDLALIADDGNLCFGGECTKRGDTFYGSYNID